MRRHDEGGAEADKMSPFKRINAEFGVWRAATPAIAPSMTTPNIVVGSSDMMLESNGNPRGATDPPPPAAAPTTSPPSANATPSRPSCRSSKPPGASCRNGTPRYSRIDTFIEDLDAAYEALPTPLVGSARAAAPPGSRAPPVREAVCSHSKQEDRQPYQHARKTQQHQEDHRPLFSTGGIVKEVKFADEVIEIGQSDGMVEERTCEEMSTSSDKNFFEFRSREPTGGKPMPSVIAAERGGAPPPRVSRALRFDYRKKRSEFVKAATVVQSTYRGYKVRKGQPLKYLVVIGSVKEKLEELRQQFDAWKIAAWFPTDLTERVTMTESVMDLLLQLDSLQSVPVVVREFRKNVARDVIKFQEEVDGFLCRNSRHGVLFDLTRAGATTQGSSNLKPTKTIRNIVVQEPNIETFPESDSPAGSTGHSGNGKEEAKAGTMTSVDVTSGPESDSRSKVSEVPLYSVQPHCSRGGDFVLWSPGDAQFEKVRVEEKIYEENQFDNVTELKKCVASTGNLNMYVPHDRKKKSLRVRFDNLNVGNRSAGREHLSANLETPNAPPENSSPCSATCVESVRKGTHQLCDVLSWEPARNRRQKNDSQCTVSINNQRSLDPYTNNRLQFPIAERIREVNESTVEDCEIRYPQKQVRPPAPAHCENAVIQKWDAEFPADLHLANSIEVHKSYVGEEIGHDLEIRHPQLLQPDHVQTEKWEQGFLAVLGCNNRIESNKSCIGMENTPFVLFKSTPAQDEDRHIRAEEVIPKDLYDDQLPTQTKRQVFPSPVEYVSANGVGEGPFEPPLASDQGDKEMDSRFDWSELDGSFSGILRTFGGHDDIDFSPRSSKRNILGISQDIPNGLDPKLGDPRTSVVLTEDGEKLDTLGFPGLEEVQDWQSSILDSTEYSPVLVTPTMNGNIRQQIDGPDNEYDPCGYDDLETISSCSNCVAYPGDCIGEPWEVESNVHAQMPRQPYALKGLVKELDEVLSERKGGDKLCPEAGQWKDEAWTDDTSTESRPLQITAMTTQPNFEREVEAVRDHGSCKSFKTVDSDKVQYLRPSEPEFVTKLVSQHQDDYPDIKELTCPESKGSDLDSTSQSSGEHAAASASSSLIPTLKNESNMLSKLVEDNKRLKELLKEVIKWNTVQANAIITLNGRLELIESKK